MDSPKCDIYITPPSSGTLIEEDVEEKRELEEAGMGRYLPAVTWPLHSWTLSSCDSLHKTGTGLRYSTFSYRRKRNSWGPLFSEDLQSGNSCWKKENFLSFLFLSCSWLPWNLLCTPGWPETHRGLPTFASRVLGLKASATMLGHLVFLCRFRSGIGHSGLDTPKSVINQENAPQTSLADQRGRRASSPLSFPLPT